MQEQKHIQMEPVQKQQDFTVGSVPKTIIRLAIPMIAAQLINALYNIVDRIYIGHIPQIGTNALTGVGLTLPIIIVASAFAMLAGMGGAPLSSIARGAGDDHKAEVILGNSTAMLLAFGVGVTVLGLAFKEPLLWMFGASQNTFSFANDYLGIYLCGSIPVMISLGLNQFINAQGFAKYGMFTILIGAVLNICLDPLFIFTFGMQVKGAALATVISQTVSALFVLWFLLSKKTILKLKLSNFRLQPKIAGRVLALGSSVFIMQVTESALMIVYNTNLKALGGDLYITAMTVMTSVMNIVNMPLMGLSQGMQPVVGYNYGAKRYDRVSTGIRFFTWIGMGYSVVVWLAIMLFPQGFISIFSSDPQVMKIGVGAFRIYFAMQFIMGLQMSAQQSFMALGKAKQAIFFAMLRKLFLLIPLIYILPNLFSLGVQGVFLSEPLADTISATSCFATFYFTVWRRLQKEQNLQERMPQPISHVE